MKAILTIFLFFLFFSACTKKKESNATAANNEKVVRLMYAHFNDHEWSKTASLYTETADFKDPSFGQNLIKQTREQTIKKYTELNAVFKDIHDEVTAVYPSGDKHVVVEFTSSGTAPDGSKFTLPICTIFTLENGLITKDFTYYDNFEEPKVEK